LKYGKKKGKAYKRSEMGEFYMNAHPQCEVCQAPSTDLHHIITRKTGGPDEYWNYLALCKIDHQVFHMMGRYSFTVRYPQFREKIQSACERMGRTFDKG